MQYVSALFWAFTTFTVGIGDIVATNDAERIYCVVVMTVGTMVFTYGITSWKTFEVLAHVVKEWEPTTPGAVRNMLDIVRRAEAEMATACGERSRASERLRELSLSLTVDGSPTAIRCR